MMPYDPFFEEFDVTLQRLVETGICPDRMNGKYWKPITNKRYNEEVPPLVLTMDDLGIGFLACAVPLFGSIIVFAFEVLIPKLKLFARILKDYLVAYQVLKAVLKLKFIDF